MQATRERLGQVAPDEITELPQGELCSFLCSLFEFDVWVLGVWSSVVVGARCTLVVVLVGLLEQGRVPGAQC